MRPWRRRRQRLAELGARPNAAEIVGRQGALGGSEHDKRVAFELMMKAEEAALNGVLNELWFIRATLLYEFENDDDRVVCRIHAVDKVTGELVASDIGPWLHLPSGRVHGTGEEEGQEGPAGAHR